MQLHIPRRGEALWLRPLTGADELLLLEAGALDLSLALALLQRLVIRLDGHAMDWALQPLPDVDAALLVLRQALLGDQVRLTTECACACQVDLTFSVHEYLAGFAPEPPEALEGVVVREQGWFELERHRVQLRVPAAADQLAIVAARDPEAALWARCVRAEELTDEVKRDIEAALEGLAPTLCRVLVGGCPDCGTQVELEFDPLRDTLAELRRRSSHLYDDVARVAHHTHWSEAEILALPSARRARYANTMSTQARQAHR